MKVLALVPMEKDVNPGQRYRIEQWEPLLRERGVEIVYSPFTFPALSRILYRSGHLVRKGALMTAAYLRQLGSILASRRFDLIYVFREASLVGPALVESLIARQGLPLVFDFDDATFVPYVSPSNGRLSYLKCFGKTETLCRIARAVMAGNGYLHDYAAQHNANVSIIPTTIDTTRYRPALRRPRPDGVPVIGWTGSYSTLQHVKTAVPLLAELGRRYTFRWVVVGTEPVEVPGVGCEFRPWSADREVEDLADIDIGIMPLPDDPWSRGKCGLKALQYMALGVPAVVSPVGVNTEIVQDGVNGCVASSSDQWLDRLSRLIQEPALREKLGREARRTVKERYAASVVAPRVFEIFQGAAVSR